MYDNIIADVKEVKKRLAALGEDADEAAICGLLKSFGPNYELDHIISIITENWDSGFQNNSGEIIFTDDKSKVQNNTEKILKPIESTQRLSTDDACAEISDGSSDYDDRYDYYSSYWDDMSIDTVTRSLPSPSELYANTSSPNHNEATSVPPEVEFLEENNNDPNNNLDSVQMLHELQNNSSDVDNENRNSNREIYMECIEKPESPKPGCSKDSHDAFISQEDSKLHVEAEQISALLPRFKYSMIYKTLCQNRNAKNRIELTLWNLLSENKPKAEFLPKCKPLVDVCPTEQSGSEIFKNNLENAHSKKLQLSGKRAVTLDECRKAKRSITESTMDIVDNNNINQLGTTLSPVVKAKLKKLDSSNIDVSIVTEKTVALEADSNNKESKSIDSLQKVVGEKHSSTAQSVLLRPAKFTFTSNISKISEPSSSTSMLNPILLPAKLKYVKTQERMDTKLSELTTENPWNVDDLKQNMNSEQPQLNTSTDGINKRASGMKIVVSHSSVSPVEGVTVVQDKTLSSVEVGEARSHESCTSRSLQPISTKDIHVIAAEKVNSGESEIKGISKPEEDINISQEAMPLPKVNVTNATIQPGSSNSLRLPDTIEYPMSYKEALCIDSKSKTYNCNSINDKTSTLFSRSLDSAKHENAMKLLDVTNIASDSVKFFTELSTLSLDFLHKETTDETQVEQKDTINKVNDKIVLSQKALQIYHKLIPMFPSIDTNYIKKLCQKYVKNEAEFLDEAVLLQDLVEMLLDRGHKHSHVKKVEPLSELNTFDVNEQYANLLGIFPEADPVYLRNIAKEIYNNPDKMKQFVQSKLEKPDYPTREQYLTKKKITEQQKQYTTGFQVQQFLEIFPDPFTHFENQERKCQFNTDAVEFLKHYFNKIRVNTLLRVYAEYKHNLSLTARYLEVLSPNLKTKRFHPLTQTENIPLLQECAFIQHKAEIMDYLAKLKEEEEKEFNELKEKNALFECQCCFDNECMPSKCSTCEDGHIFCNSCIVKSTDVKLGDGETHIHCLLNCNCEFPLSVLQKILSPTKFSILLQKRQEAEVMAAGLEGLVSCPFCHFASIPPEEDKVFKCLNPDCMKESCRTCKEINHLPLKCDEVKSDVARLLLEEKMTEALVRKCFHCTRTFFKEEGCNKMTCLCGAQMCYICDQPIKDYKHFRGQGDTRSDLCPLWSDDFHMNAAAVIKVCEETMKHIKEKNPQVEIDADSLMPKLPAKRRGPHQDVANADNLPTHVTRIIREIP